jgi:hypothetical protein
MALVETYAKQFEMHLYLFGQQLLAQVAQDNNLDHMAMVKKYLSKPEGPAPINNGQNIPAPMLVMASQEKAKKPRKVNPDKVMCKGVTAKGQPCKFAAQTGCDFCKKHSEEAESSKTPKVPKAQKAPEHNHKPGEVPQEICGVCDSHGDITKPGLPEEEFKLEEGNIRDKLKQILKEASDSEQEEDVTTLEELGINDEDVSQFKAEMMNEAPMNGGNTPQGSDNEEDEDEEALKNKLAAILAQEDEDEDDE